MLKTPLPRHSPQPMEAHSLLLTLAAGNLTSATDVRVRSHSLHDLPGLLKFSITVTVHHHSRNHSIRRDRVNALLGAHCSVGTKPPSRLLVETFPSNAMMSLLWRHWPLTINDHSTQASQAVVTIAIRLRCDDTTTHSTTTEEIEVTVCVRFDSRRMEACARDTS